jgi:hypothetical protein
MDVLENGEWSDVNDEEEADKATESMYALTYRHTGRADNRIRKDRLINVYATWESFYQALTTAYLHWDAHGPPKPSTASTTPTSTSSTLHAPVMVVELFSESYYWVYTYSLTTAAEIHEFTPPVYFKESLVITLAKYGFLATSPEFPSYTISFDALKLFHVLINQCPQASIQAYVRCLSDLASVSVI